jgi:DNA-binding NarL/FixJ family response regulator
MAIRVVVADDSYLIREAVAQLLAREDGVDVVAVGNDYDTTLRAVEETRPDVVLTDIRMPPTQTDKGIRLPDALRRRFPDTGIVVLSQYGEPRYALMLLEDGSAGRAYLLKERLHDRAQLSVSDRPSGKSDRIRGHRTEQNPVQNGATQPPGPDS